MRAACEQSLGGSISLQVVVVFLSTTLRFLLSLNIRSQVERIILIIRLRSCRRFRYDEPEITYSLLRKREHPITDAGDLFS